MDDEDFDADRDEASAELQNEACDAIRGLMEDHDWSQEEVLQMLEQTVFA